MRKINITRTVKNILLLLSIFLSFLVLLFGLLFSNFKEKAYINAKKDYELNIDRFTNKFEDKILLFDKLSIEDYIKDARNTNYIKNIKIKLNKYFLNKENLVFQTKSFSDTSWNLADITTDIKFGEIRKIGNSSYFEFIPSAGFNLTENLIVKYQLFKNNEIINFIVPIDLNLVNNQDIELSKLSFNWIFEYFYDIKIDEIITRDLKIDDLTYATIEYILDDFILKQEVNDYFNKLLILVVVLFLPIAILIIYYDKYLENKYVVKPIMYLDKVVSDIIDHKFTNIENKIFDDSNEYNNLLKNISKLSNKVASLVNELNINKETLERNLLTDNLTGLYDKKMFDIDMKSMFVSSVEGYIFLLKIGKLNQIENSNGTLKTDDFILSYVNIINNIIHLYNNNNNINFYRFHGAEFIILAKDMNNLAATDFSNKVINTLLSEISKTYKLPNDIFHIGGAPINKYGTIDSIIDLVNEAYSEAVSNGGNGYKILEESKINEEVRKTELKVKQIIENNDFEITFAFDSYSFEDDKLLMRELKPILKDDDGNILPIGSFIAISEKLELNKKFDQEIILKALSYIKKNRIDYKIAINLSMKTVSDAEFIQFLEELVIENEDFVNNILFSITSYSAFAYKKEFVAFVEQLNNIGIKILVKRYKTKEYSLEELSDIKIDYIKIDKDLTQNIHNDLVKKHRIKNIIVFAEVNDVKVMVENVESDKDYAFLSKLDLYAVNR